MKLFHKIFLCFVLLFGIAFQAAGYLLINFVYGNAVEQEKKYAFQEFQYNRYILQSILYMEPELLTDGGSIIESFQTPAALYGADGSCIFSNIKAKPDFENFQEEEDGRIAFWMHREDGKSYIYVYDCIRQGENTVYLVTETDITSVIDAQKGLIVYFQRICLGILGVGFLVIFLLTRMLTSSIKKVNGAAGRIAGGNYSERIAVGGKDEISELAADFNQMADKVEEKIAELSNAAREKEDFMANFAHELKTPLTSVIGYADMLYQRELPAEQVKSAAEYILNEGMRLEALSLKLMDLFVLNKQDFLLESMAVTDIFENMKRSMESVCGKKAALHMDICGGRIDADFDLFKTMILNMVDNAVKADCSDVWILGKRERDVYRISVRDNGKGIPPGELGRITEAFYMVDKSRSRRQHGAGLGMALTAKIVEIHRADMKIESDGRTGTTVSVAFRLSKTREDEGEGL